MPDDKKDEDKYKEHTKKFDFGEMNNNNFDPL